VSTGAGDRAALRSVIVELGEAARSGVQDPRDVVGGYVEALLELRYQARAAKRYDESDLIRDRLVELGVEVRDTADGVEWELGD
jgi:cysteinyl-tRNA synthetase